MSESVLVNHGYATGMYTCKCSCGVEFMGDKRASTCLNCAIKKELQQKQIELLDEVKAEIGSQFYDLGGIPLLAILKSDEIINKFKQRISGEGEQK